MTQGRTESALASKLHASQAEGSVPGKSPFRRSERTQQQGATGPRWERPDKPPQDKFRLADRTSGKDGGSFQKGSLIKGPNRDPNKVARAAAAAKDDQQEMDSEPEQPENEHDEHESVGEEHSEF